MRTEDAMILLVDGLVDRLTALAAGILFVWLFGSLMITIVREWLHTRRIRIEQEAKTAALRQEMAMRNALAEDDT